MVEIMKELGRESNLTKDIYPLVKERGTELGKKWKARVRATLEENSSDVDGWKGIHDLFENRDKGKGNWILRGLEKSNLKQDLNVNKYFPDLEGTETFSPEGKKGLFNMLG